MDSNHLRASKEEGADRQGAASLANLGPQPTARAGAMISRQRSAARWAPLLIAALLTGCGGEDPTDPGQASPAAREAGPPEPRGGQARPQVVPDQYIIIFRSDADLPPGIVNTLAKQHGLGVRHTFHTVFEGFSAVVPTAALPALRNHPLIGSIEPVGLFYLDAPVADLTPVSVPQIGLRLRLVADQLQLANGADLDVWPNLGGSEGAASQSNASKRPAFHAAGATGKFAGHAHVGFNEGETDEYLQVSGVASHGSATLVAVFSQTDKAAHNYGLLATYKNANSRGTFATMFTGSGDLLGYWDFSIGQHYSTFSPTAGGEHVAVWRIDGSNVLDFQVDGVSQGSVPITSDIHPGFNRYLIGAPEPTGVNPFDGQLAELVLYDRPLSDCERDLLVADLGAQYGIDVNGAGAACDPPAAPTGLSATSVDAWTIDLAWTDGSNNEDGFTVERREGQSGTFAPITQTGAGVTAYSDGGLAAATEYCYRVAAFNGNGSSSYTAVQCATTGSPPPPPSPPIAVPGQGLRLRLVASELSLANGAEVDVWPNLGGSEGAASQSDASKRPAFHAAGATGKFAGHAHVGFNEGETDEYLQVSGVASHGSATLVAVFSQTDKAAHNYGLLAIYEDANNRGTFATMFTGSGDPLGYWDFSIGQAYSTFSPTAGGEHVAVWRIDGSNVLDFQVDGVSQGSVPITSDMHPVFSRYLIGAPEPTGVNPFDGQLAELVLYDRPLSDCERDQLVADLGAQYGVDVNGAGAGACDPPAAPTGLSATSVDAWTIELGWTDGSSNEDGFRLERRQGQTGAFQLLADLGPDVTSFTDGGLAAGTEYCYRVAAFNGNGSSSYTAVQCATTASPPPPPSPPIAVPGQGLRLRLVASELGLANGTEVDVWPNLGGSEGAASQSDASKRPAFHAPGVSGKFAGHAHVGFNEGETDEYLQVSGVASHGSATLVAVFSQTDKAAHNYGLLATYENANNRGTFATMFTGSGDLLGYWDFSIGQAYSTFSPTAGGEHVAVWRIDGSNVLDFQVDGVSQGSVPITSDMHPVFSRYLIGAPEPTGVNPFDGQLAELVLYDRPLSDCERDQLVADLGAQYGVDVNGAGAGACDPPAAPTGLSATSVDAWTIELAWTDGSTNEDGFTVERREGQSGTFAPITQTGAGVTAYSDGGLAAATEYCYRVAAFNGNGSSSYTAVQCATTGSPPPPPSPPIAVPGQGLRLRLVASELSLANGAEVDVWPNLGGSEGAASQSDASKRPAFHAPGVSGKFAGHAHVGFNEGETDEYLQVSGVASHGSATLVAVFSQTDKAAHNYGLLAIYGDANNRGTFATMFTGSGDPLGYWDFSIGQHYSTFSPTAGGEHVAVWRIDGSNVLDFQVDGVSQGSVPITSDMHPVFSRYLVGAPEPTGVNPFDGQLAELVLYDRPLSDCEQDQLVADLGAQYGIDVNGAGAGACDPPAAPTGLSATSVDAWTIDLGWSDGSSNEDGFTVERREGQSGTFAPITQTGAGVTAYTDGGLAAGTEYCYRVAAFNGNGSSSYTAVQCATTATTPPPPPPVAVPDQGLRLRLIADQLSLANGTEVDVWPNLGGSEGAASQSDASKRPAFHSAGATGKFGGHAHVGFNEGETDEYLQVSGVASHGSATLVAVFSQTDKAAHNYGLLAIYENANNRGTFATMFTGSGDLLGYWDFSIGQHYSTFSPTAGGEHVAVWRIDGSNVLDFQVDGVSHGSVPITSDMHPVFSRYLIGAPEPTGVNPFDGQLAELVLYDRPLLDCEQNALVAELGAQYGIDVNGVDATPCDPPAAPSELSATAADYRTIDLAWTDGSSNEDGFRLERRQGQTGAFQLLADLDPDITSFTDSTVMATTEYCYRVVAYNGDGSSASDIACETTPAPPPGVCYDSGNHDDVADLWNIQRIEADQNKHWLASQVPGCEMRTWIFILDSGVDSDHPDLNVVDIQNFVAADQGNTGEDGNGHGTHVAGIAAAKDGNGGVVGVAPGAPIHGYRVCGDNGSCQEDDILAAIDAVTAVKLANPNQPMVANMSLAGSVTPSIDTGVRRSTNAGVVYAVGAGNGILGACFFPANAQNVSPAGVGDDAINAQNGSDGDTARINGVLTVTLSNEFDQDGDCNYGNPVTIAAPGANILSAWLNGGYNVISGTSMASPHGAGAAALYLQEFPAATPADVEAWIVGQLDPWSTDDKPNADGRLNVRRP